MKVSDYRKLLSQLPQDAEMMAYQDEMGFFYDAGTPSLVKIRKEQNEEGETHWDFAELVEESEMLGEDEVVRIA